MERSYIKPVTPVVVRNYWKSKDLGKPSKQNFTMEIQFFLFLNIHVSGEKIYARKSKFL